MDWPAPLGRRTRDGLLAILGMAALSLAAFYTLYEPRERPVRLRMTRNGGRDIASPKC
jgi:hypothetical protein